MLEFNLFGIPYVSKTLESPFLHLFLLMIAASTREPADSNLWLHVKRKHSIVLHWLWGNHHKSMVLLHLNFTYLSALCFVICKVNERSNKTQNFLCETELLWVFFHANVFSINFKQSLHTWVRCLISLPSFWVTPMHPFMLNISGRPWIFGEIRHSLKKTNSNHSNSGDLHLKWQYCETNDDPC